MAMLKAYKTSGAIMFPRSELSIAEVETLTGLSRSTIYRLMNRGQLRTAERGRRRVVPVSELAAVVPCPGLDEKAWNSWFQYRTILKPFGSARAIRTAKETLAGF